MNELGKGRLIELICIFKKRLNQAGQSEVVNELVLHEKFQTDYCNAEAETAFFLACEVSMIEYHVCRRREGRFKFISNMC